jgi:Calcineurin-like phosphoesterase
MRIAVMSDLHLELDAREHGAVGSDHAMPSFYLRPPEPQADVLVLAGDIHAGAQGVSWADRHFALPVVLVCGNHEPYGHELFRLIANNRQRAGSTNGHVWFLERATWTYRSESGERARFIGATLWTDFQLYGTPQASMAIALQRLEDFSVIKIERGYKLRSFRPSDSARVCEASVAFLRTELSKPFGGITVVVTHHAPSRRSIATAFENDTLNPAFVSDFEELITTYAPALWIHGHVHDSFDYTIGRTRVVCNPRGYFPDQLNARFDPFLVVEVFHERRAPKRA